MSEPELGGHGGAAGQCPACHRPIAVPGPRCLYCGAALSEERPAPRAAEANAATARLLVIVDTHAEAGALAAALGRQLVEVGALKRRARYLLHRILPEIEAGAERQRLQGLGVGAWTVRESAVRPACQPICAIVGDPAQGSFGTGTEAVRVAASDVLLLVIGPVRREPQSVELRSLRGLRRTMGSHATDSELWHVHCRGLGRPIELDAESFVFSRTSPQIESTWRRLRTELVALAGAAEVDDGFRHETPALGMSERATQNPFGAGEARPGDAKRETPTYLDNLAQFRYYSAWRGALARQLAGLPPTAEPPL